jgi:protein-disulfide isomerase
MPCAAAGKRNRVPRPNGCKELTNLIQRTGKRPRIWAAAFVLTAIACLCGKNARPDDRNATGERIIRYVRERYNIPEQVKVTVGPFQDSPFADFYQTTLTLDDGKQKNSQKFFLSRDGRYLVEGAIFNLNGNPRTDIERSISLEDQPIQGPARAPVTIVEYADLQCPTCAELHEFLEKQVALKYGDKVRIVFKEFPLPNIHNWALTAALASECVFQMKPEAFVPYRALVFQEQNSLDNVAKDDGAKALDPLLDLGDRAGVDRAKLAACVNSGASMPRVEENVREGQMLGIARTPTSFVNGRVVVGKPEPAEFFKIVDEALRTTAR